MRWQIEVPLLTNRFVMTDVVVGCAVTVFICWMILFLAFAWGSDFRDLGQVWRVSATFAMDGSRYLEGNTIEGSYAPALTPDALSERGWTKDDLVKFFRTAKQTARLVA